MIKLIKNTFLFKATQPLYCGGGGGDGGAAAAEQARREEQARLEALKKAEEARILKETLENKTAQASKESSAAAARTSLMDKAKTALESPEAAKKKTLLSNYSN
jgi:hypothetical protein